MELPSCCIELAFQFDYSSMLLCNNEGFMSVSSNELQSNLGNMIKRNLCNVSGISIFVIFLQVDGKQVPRDAHHAHYPFNEPF